MFKLINILILLFYIFANANAVYVPYHNHYYDYKPTSFEYYTNDSYNVKYYRLQKIYNNNPRPCETCGGKFYILKNKTFGKNFSIVKDSINEQLYIDKVICKDTKLSWNVKYPCNNHVHTIKFVNPEWEWNNEDIQKRKQIENELKKIRIKHFILEPMAIVVFCFLIFIIIAMFNSKEPRKIINKYTSIFIIGVIILLVYGVLMVATTNFPNYVNNESQYCISVVDADSTLTDSLIYQIDSIADIKNGRD